MSFNQGTLRAPGKIHHVQLRCSICATVDDYVLDIYTHGPMADKAYRLRKCPNCLRRGITSFMEKSNK